MRKQLYGGHGDGWVVVVDDPAPVYLQVPYREPCTDPGCMYYPLCWTCGIDMYELAEVITVQGHRTREYFYQPGK